MLHLLAQLAAATVVTSQPLAPAGQLPDPAVCDRDRRGIVRCVEVGPRSPFPQPQPKPARCFSDAECTALKAAQAAAKPPKSEVRTR